MGEDCEISLWASWIAREPLGENILLTTLRRPFQGRQACYRVMMIALGGLDRQRGCIHREINSCCVRLWFPGGFNGHAEYRARVGHVGLSQ